MTRAVPPNNIYGKLGYYCLASDAVITSGTWEAATAAADVTALHSAPDAQIAVPGSAPPPV